MSEQEKSRPPLPPFDATSAAQKVRMAEDAWNTRSPERVSLAYTRDSSWRNRSEFLSGREAIVEFLIRKWNRELDYRLIKELWAFHGAGSRSASRTSGTTIPETGFAPTGTRTGNSTNTGSCGAASPASTISRFKRASASTVGRSGRVQPIIPVRR